jgi:hypothetical protein
MNILGYCKARDEMLQPIPDPVVKTKPKPVKLTKARRKLIIKDFQEGKEDPECAVKELSAGKYRLTVTVIGNTKRLCQVEGRAPRVKTKTGGRECSIFFIHNSIYTSSEAKWFL